MTIVHITEQVTESLKQALRGGNDVETAAHFAGVSVANVYRWLEIGKFESERISAGEPANPDNAEFVEFWEGLRKARAEAIVRNVTYVQNAAKSGSWQAAAWWLERAVPEQYSRTKSSGKAVEGEPQRQVSGE